jgi:hypothetical protein
MAIRTDDPVGVVVDALIGADGTRRAPTAPTAPPAAPVMARLITVAKAAATASSVARRIMNA